MNTVLLLNHLNTASFDHSEQNEPLTAGAPVINYDGSPDGNPTNY